MARTIPIGPVTSTYSETSRYVAAERNAAMITDSES